MPQSLTHSEQVIQNLKEASGHDIVSTAESFDKAIEALTNEQAIETIDIVLEYFWELKGKEIPYIRGYLSLVQYFIKKQQERINDLHQIIGTIE